MDTNLRRQENNLSLTNTFTKGMNTDVAYDFVSNDLYLFGKNIRIVNNAVLCEEPDSNNVNGVVAPVPAGKGVSFVFKDVRKEPEQGQSTEYLWTSDDVDRILAVKTVDNIGAIILKYKGTNEEPTKGLWRVFKAEKIQEKNDQDVLEDKIALTYVYVSTEKTDRDRFSIAINKETTDLTKLYIADGVHSMIIINLTEKDLSYYQGLTEDELSPNRMFPDKSPVFVAKITGTLLTSQVQYAYRLYKKHGVCSKMSPLTPKIQVISNSRQTDVGNEEDTQSSVGFRLRIDIKKRHAQLYDKLLLYRVLYIKYGEEPKCELIWDAKFIKDGLSDESETVPFYISDNGLKALQEYTTDEFNQINGLTVIPQLIDYNQQYMFAANIKDESVIKIPDTELNMTAFSKNINDNIRLYRSLIYLKGEYLDFETIAAAEDECDTYYINKYTDMSIGDTYYDLSDDDKCMFIPEWYGDYILGGAGIISDNNKPIIEWKFIVRLSPIHDNVYDKHFADDNLYTNQVYYEDPTTGEDAMRNVTDVDQLASMLWGYAKEIESYSYKDYTIDVPRVSSTECEQYGLLKLNENGLIIACDFYLSDDEEYLTQHQIEVSNRSNSFDDIFTSSMFRSLLRGEVYRYGIVFYDVYGNKTDVKWIADIRVPSANEFPITKYEDDNGGKTLYSNSIGVQFKVNIPSAIKEKYNLIKYEIVRCLKTPEYCKTLIQVATSRPLSLKQFMNDTGSEETYYPYYASALLTTDPYQIGFKMNRGQGRDFASCSEVNNYHRGNDYTTHQLDFLLLFSPEILYRREDVLDLLLGSQTKLQTIWFSNSGLYLNDYDVIFRCKHQYIAELLTGGAKYTSNRWEVVDDFKLGIKGAHNRCLEYGLCLYGKTGQRFGQTSNNWDEADWEKKYIYNIHPYDEHPSSDEFQYIHPHIGLFLGSSEDPDEQQCANLPKEWHYDYNYIWQMGGRYEDVPLPWFAWRYVYRRDEDGDEDEIVGQDLDYDYKDTLVISATYKIHESNGGEAGYFRDDDKSWLIDLFLGAPYLVIGGIYNSRENDRLRMFTPFPVLNRAYIENNKDIKSSNCYMFKNYYTFANLDYLCNKYTITDTESDQEVEKTQYSVFENTILDIKSISDVQNPLWEDGFTDVETSSSIVDTAVKKYKTYLTSVGSKTYCNWSACGLYNWRVGQNDTVSRVTPGYYSTSEGDDQYNRILYFFNHAAEDAKDYAPGSTAWGNDNGTGEANGAPQDYWTYPSKDLRWNNGWFGPGPVCFLAELSENLGLMDFEYGLFMSIGMGAPIRQKQSNFSAMKTAMQHSAEYSTNNPNAYSHAYFSSFGTWVCNIIHNASNFEGVTKENKYYDRYLSFSNIADINIDLCVFDGDTYILPCEFTSCFKTYNNNAADSTIPSQQFVYYIPMETKINVCFDYGKNYRNTVNPNLQLEEGDMEGVASQDRPLHQYNYIYSDNNNSIVQYMASIDEDEITHIEHRIVYSEPKTNGELIDSWNTFKAANFIDADSHYGKITYLFTVKDIIHFWLTRAFGRLTVNERSLVTDENQNLITLGTGGVVQRTDYISTNYGMKQYDMSAVNAESDVYWIDRTNNILAVYSQGRVGSIGELHNVQNLINHLIDQDNLPTIHYDINAKEVIAKFLHQIDNNVETIEQLIYNTRVNIATAVYTRDYDDILEFNNVLYGINIKETEATLYNFLSKDDVSDYLHPARLSFLVNIAPDTTKVFDNQKIVTTKRKSYNQEYTKNYMLNKKYTFTTDIHDTKWNQFNEASEAITDREGNILYTIPRYGDNVKWGSRLNGKWMKVDLDMMLDYQVTGQNNQTETKYQLADDKPISQIITKFRRSYV